MTKYVTCGKYIKMLGLTPCKEYKVIKEDNTTYLIKNDEGIEIYHLKELF